MAKITVKESDITIIKIDNEEEQKQLGWSAKRELAKINYHIHTSAISRNLIPKKLTKEQINYIYAVFINEGTPQQERLIKLNQIAIQQMGVLMEVEGRKMLKE